MRLIAVKAMFVGDRGRYQRFEAGDELPYTETTHALVATGFARYDQEPETEPAPGEDDATTGDANEGEPHG